MKARHLFTALLALTTVTAVACDDDDEDPNGPPDTNTFTASLSGANERPNPVTTTTATGTATFTSSTSGATTTITYTVNITGGSLSGPITAAHIHGPAGANAVADPIVTLTAVTGTGTSFSGSFTTTGGSVTMAQLLTHMLAGNTYINLHTAANPGGEIRGQIAD